MNKNKLNLIANEIRLWSSEVLEVSSSAFGGMPPCPYAAKTWQNNQFALHFVEDLSAVVELKSILDQNDLLTHIAVWLDPASKTVEQFDEWIEDQNKNHFGIWLMGFHPDADGNDMTEAFEGLEEVEDDYGLILVQSLAHLVTASDVLSRTNYYDNFPPDYMADIKQRKEVYDAWESKTNGKIQEDHLFSSNDEEEEIEVRVH